MKVAEEPRFKEWGGKFIKGGRWARKKERMQESC